MIDQLPHMTRAPVQGPRASSPVCGVIAVLMLMAALAIFYAAVLRLDLYQTRLLNLDPHPDADEYFAGAVSLARTGTFRIHNAGRMIPPRYPFGFSAMMTPLMWLGVDPVTVPFRVNQLLGLGLILGAFGMFWRTGDRIAAGLTSLFLATLPGLSVLSRSPMSDLSGATVILASFYCFWRYVRSRPGDLRWGLAGSALLGVGIWIRTPNQLFMGLFVPIALFGQPQSINDRLRTLAIFGLTFLVAVSPVLVYNYWSFGSPLKTGYDYWMPHALGSSSPRAGLHPARLGAQTWYMWSELVQEERALFSIARSFGSGSYLNPSLVLLAIVGVVSSLRGRDRAVLVIGGSALAQFLPVLILRGADARYWFVFPLILPFIAGRQMSALVRQALAGPRRDWLSAVAIFFLIGATVAGWPGHKGSLETLDVMDLRRFRGQSQRYIAAKHLARLTAGNRTLIVTRFNTSYIYALTAGDRIVSPVHPIDMPTFNPAWFPPAARRAQIDEALSTGRIVYALMTKLQLETDVPRVEGYRWDPVWRGREDVAAGAAGEAIIHKVRRNGPFIKLDRADVIGAGLAHWHGDTPIPCLGEDSS